MNRGWIALTGVVAIFWQLGSLGAAEGPVWPPIASSAPAEVEWLGLIGEYRPKGVGRIFRAVAGAERRQQSWQLPQPVAVALVKDRVFTVDTALGWVLGGKSDGRSAFKLKLPDGFSPVAVASTSEDDLLLVADRGSGLVLAFEADGSPRGEAVAAGLVRRCGGIGVCANGDILITDADAGQVVRVQSKGDEVARTGRPGTGDGEFNTPTAVVEAPDGTIWVLDTFNFRVQQFDAQLRYLSEFGKHGDGSGHFALTKGMAVDPDGHIYLSDARFDAIQVFDEEGRLLFIVGGRGHGPGQFWNPGGVAIDTRGRMAVADTGNRRVQLLQYQKREGRK